MTDRESLKAMFKRAKINYLDKDTEVITFYGKISDDSILVEGGYVGFFTEFEFDEKGNLLSAKAWE